MKGHWDSNKHWSTEVLWDGKCHSRSKCCNQNGMPFLNKKLAYTTGDDIEVRICHNFDDENIGVAIMELFVR